MNSFVQVISLSSSFVYGILVYYLNNINCRVTLNKSIITKLLISILYLFNVSIIYVIFLYKLNNGVLHIYNILFILIGYVLIAVKKRKS